MQIRRCTAASSSMMRAVSGRWHTSRACVASDHRRRCFRFSSISSIAVVLARAQHGRWRGHPHPGTASLLSQGGAEVRQHTPDEGEYGVAMLFLPTDEEGMTAGMRIFEDGCAAEGIPLLFWRDVPVDCHDLGTTALECMPVIKQAFVGRPSARQSRRGLRTRALRLQAHHREASADDTRACPARSSMYAR